MKIGFKNPKDAREGTMRSATEADGLHYVYLTFPEGADVGNPAGDDPAKPGTEPEN